MTKSAIKTIVAALLAWHVGHASAEPPSERMTVTVRGKGPNVLLIPGLACSGAVWDATAKHLEGHFRVHVIQVAGFAGSPARANARGPVLQPTVDAIANYIKTNDLKAPKVIGHSIGGFMGLMLVHQHPGDVEKLMIVDSLPFFSALFGASDAAAATPQAAAMRDTILNENQDAYAQGEEQFLGSMVKSPEGRKAATQWAVASDKSVVAVALYEDMTTDLRAKLPEINVPVTVLYPWDALTRMPKTAVDKLYGDNYASLAHRTMVRIDDSLHFIMLDQPSAFLRQVDAFLK